MVDTLIHHLIMGLIIWQVKVGLYQVYYNFCLPHASLKVAGKNERSRKKWQPRSPAMAVGLTDHLWSLGEVLAFRVPPWPQPGAALAA